MANRLVILHYFPRIRSEEGGVVKAILDLTLALAQSGHRAILATCDATDVPSEWDHTSGSWPEVVELETCSWIESRLSSKSLRKVESLVREADIVHLHSPWEISNLQLRLIIQKNRVPYVVSVHGMLDDYCMRQKKLKKRLFLKLCGRQLFRNATTVHFTAKGEQDQATKWIPGNYQVAVQALTMDLSPYQELPGPEEALDTFIQIVRDRPKVLFLSRVQSKKGLELLLAAVNLLGERKLDVQLLIAGPGETAYIDQLKSLATSLGIQERTHFLGMVRGSLKLSLYQLADVFVLPTYQENFGLVLPEALACGTPVVTTRGTDIWPELQQAGAKIVDLSPPAISDAIEGLLQDPALRAQLGLQGRDYVLRWLESETVIGGYEQMYRTALENQPSEFLKSSYGART